jgi:1-acyl-sn-glycerol-3-phosphate acyltransferase
VGRAVTSAIVYAMYRSVEVRRPDADYSGRPVIIVANHSSGFPDPVLIMYGMGRRPRFLAKATLWSNVVVGKVFDLAGVIPVNRAEDGDTDGNESAFAACNEALREDEVIAIFPEGQIHHGSTISEIHTGTARIALGARASGATGIAIVPVGLYYEAKPGRRGRVFAIVGESIDLDADIERYVEPGEDDGDANRNAVRRLTDEISVRLRDVAPDYSSPGEWKVLAAAAEVTVRSRQYDPSVPVSFGTREELARMLQVASPSARADVVDAAARYQHVLEMQRIRDVNIASYTHIGASLPDHTIRSLGTVVALAPTAAVGLATNIVPMAAMRLLSNTLKVNQLMKSTIQTLASPIVYAASWTALGAILRARGVRSGVTIAWLAGGVGGWALVLASESSDAVRDGLSGWIRMGAQGPSEEAQDARRALIDAVEAATGYSTTR